MFNNNAPSTNQNHKQFKREPIVRCKGLYSLHIYTVLFVASLLGFAITKDSHAQSDEFIVSYVEHEGIIHYYMPLLKKAYQRIGIDVKFVLINDQRALKLLNSGQIDADTAKSLETVHTYESIVYIPKPISKIEVFFLCQQTIQCDKSVLKDKKKILGVIGANEFYRELLSDSTIKQVELTSFETLFKMFDQKKVDVAIVVLDAYSLPKLAKYPNHYKIEEKLGYHLLNKKHAHIMDKLQVAIDEILVEGYFY